MGSHSLIISTCSDGFISEIEEEYSVSASRSVANPTDGRTHKIAFFTQATKTAVHRSSLVMTRNPMIEGRRSLEPSTSNAVKIGVLGRNMERRRTSQGFGIKSSKSSLWV